MDINFGDGINIPHGRIDAMLLSSTTDMSPPICLLTSQEKIQLFHWTSLSFKTPNTFGLDSGM